MSRLPRLFVPGFPQLITQRGNNRAQVFLDDEDHARYLSHMREALRESGVHLHAWVLMPDHAHLLVSAPEAEATGRFMQRLGRRYVRAFNDRHQRSGTLWEGRFRSTVLEPGAWLLAASRYIELNPVRAGLVTSPEHYVWSSCRHHLGLERDALLADHAAFWALGNTPFERQAAWRGLLARPVAAQELAALRHAAHTGWMLGELPRGEAQPSRRLAPLPKGRPRKNDRP